MSSSRREGIIRLLLLATVIAIAFVALRSTGALGSAAQLVRELRVWRDRWWLAPAFVLAYAALVSIAFPGGILTLAGGVLFGLGLGALLNALGATLGAAGAYALARWIAGSAAERLLGGHSAILRRLQSRQDVFWTVLRLRLVPLVPFNLLNVAGGVARVPFGAYLVATAIGILPGTVVYTYFADALVNGLAGAQRHALVNLCLAALLLLALSFLPAAVQRCRRRSPAA